MTFCTLGMQVSRTADKIFCDIISISTCNHDPVSVYSTVSENIASEDMRRISLGIMNDFCPSEGESVKFEVAFLGGEQEFLEIRKALRSNDIPREYVFSTSSSEFESERHSRSDGKICDTPNNVSCHRERLLSIAEFVLPRDESENWLSSAEEYYNDYAKRTSQRRSDAKLVIEVFGLFWSRIWKPIAAAVGITALKKLFGKISGQ